MKTETILKKIEELPKAPRVGRPIKWDRRIVLAVIEANQRGVTYKHLAQVIGINPNYLCKMVRDFK